MSRVLAIPDLHCPYQHPKAFEFVARLAKDFKPDRVVCLGDEIDGYGWSRFGRQDPDAMGQGDEVKAARDALKPFYERFPKVSVCRSNHTERSLRTAKRAGLPSAWVREAYEVLQAPRGWKWQDEWLIDGVYYFHGEGHSGKNAATKAAENKRRSCVIGHVHTFGGVSWLANSVDRIFGMVAGCLIDFNAPAFDYARGFPKTPVLGLGLVDDGEPTFVPMSL